MPPGLVLSPFGVLSGRPGSAGTTTINVRVTDTTGSGVTVPLTLAVAPGPPPPPPPEQLVVVDSPGNLATASPIGPQSVPYLPNPTVDRS